MEILRKEMHISLPSDLHSFLLTAYAAAVTAESSPYSLQIRRNHTTTSSLESIVNVKQDYFAMFSNQFSRVCSKIAMRDLENTEKNDEERIAYLKEKRFRN